MIDLWQQFWSNRSSFELADETDLFKQAAHTVNKQPIAASQFWKLVDYAVAALQLSDEDVTSRYVLR